MQLLDLIYFDSLPLALHHLPMMAETRILMVIISMSYIQSNETYTLNGYDMIWKAEERKEGRKEGRRWVKRVIQPWTTTGTTLLCFGLYIMREFTLVIPTIGVHMVT
jgi:hypothetical protein